jgi:SAM-dependent methyltransferase
MTDLAFLDHTRSSYNAVVDGYAERFALALADNPTDRALLTLFAELALAGPVADVGCGPGRITVFLHELGLDVFGVDLSPGMIAHARSEHPGLRFEVGTMTALDIADESLAGLNAWYSTIHIPDDHLPSVFAEFRRVLAPGAPLMLAFQVGDEPKHYAEAFGHEVNLTFHRRRPDQVADLLIKAGLEMYATTVLEPTTPEQRMQAAFLIARKPVMPPE